MACESCIPNVTQLTDSLANGNHPLLDNCHCPIAGGGACDTWHFQVLGLFVSFLPGISLSFIYYLSLVSPTPRGELTSVGTLSCHSFPKSGPPKALPAKQEMQKARSCLTTLKSCLLTPPQETLLDCLKASIQKFLVNKLLQPIQINTVFCNVLPLQTPMSFKKGGRTEGGREERRKRSEWCHMFVISVLGGRDGQITRAHQPASLAYSVNSS